MQTLFTLVMHGLLPCLFSGVITDARTICLHYVKSPWFILDIIAVLPLELAVLVWVGSGEHWDYIALFRINRIVKVWKVKGQVDR